MLATLPGNTPRLLHFLVLAFCLLPHFAWPQTEAQAGQDAIAIQKLKNNRTFFLQKGDKIIYPTESEAPYHEQKGTITAIDSLQLQVVDRQGNSQTIDLNGLPYFRPIRSSHKFWGWIMFGAGLVVRSLTFLIGIWFMLIYLFSGGKVGRFFWILIFEPFSTLLFYGGVYSLFKGRRKISTNKFRWYPARISGKEPGEEP